MMASPQVLLPEGSRLCPASGSSGAIRSVTATKPRQQRQRAGVALTPNPSQCRWEWGRQPFSPLRVPSSLVPSVPPPAHGVSEGPRAPLEKGGMSLGWSPEGSVPSGALPRAVCAALPPWLLLLDELPTLTGAPARSCKKGEQHQKQKVEGSQEERGQEPFPSFSSAL